MWSMELERNKLMLEKGAKVKHTNCLKTKKKREGVIWVLFCRKKTFSQSINPP